MISSTARIMLVYLQCHGFMKANVGQCYFFTRKQNRQNSIKTKVLTQDQQNMKI